MLRRIGVATVVGPILWLMSSNPGTAQTTPTLPPPEKFEKSEKTIVVNPTDDECKKGWSEDLKWSKDQFEAYCTRLRMSK